MNHPLGMASTSTNHPNPLPPAGPQQQQHNDELSKLMEQLYPPLPNKVHFRGRTFVEPDFSVRFPVLPCCNGLHGHTMMGMGNNGLGQQQMLPKSSASSAAIPLPKPLVVPPPQNNTTSINFQSQFRSSFQFATTTGNTNMNKPPNAPTIKFNAFPEPTAASLPKFNAFPTTHVHHGGMPPMASSSAVLAKPKEDDEFDSFYDDDGLLLSPVKNDGDGDGHGRQREDTATRMVEEQDNFVLLDDNDGFNRNPILNQTNANRRFSNEENRLGVASSAIHVIPHHVPSRRNPPILQIPAAQQKPPAQFQQQRPPTVRFDNSVVTIDNYMQKRPPLVPQHQQPKHQPPPQPRASTSSRREVIEVLECNKQPKVKVECREAANEHAAMDDFILNEPAQKDSNWLSFLRPNLAFDVVSKSAANNKKVYENLQSIYPNGSGVIFCMSTKDADDMAELWGQGAHSFHMQMSDAARKEAQRRWTNNEIRVICATVFGKSVAKQDVRFIVHHTLPQSLHTYQEQCALAGLDGLPAHCILLYNFNDHLRVRRLIADVVPRPPANVVEIKERALMDVLRYGENVAECRRAFLARHFGEEYTSERCVMCLEPCTVCSLLADGRRPWQMFDFTQEALAIFQSTAGLRNSGIAYAADLFRGQMTKKRVKQAVEEANHGRLPLFGLGHGLTEHDCQRLFHKLVIDDFLGLRLVSTKHGTVVGYLFLSKRGGEFMRKYKRAESVPMDERICMHVMEAKEKRRSSTKVDDLDGSKRRKTN